MEARVLAAENSCLVTNGRCVVAALSETPVTSVSFPGEAPMLSATYTSWNVSEKIIRYGRRVLVLQGNFHSPGTNRTRNAYKLDAYEIKSSYSLTSVGIARDFAPSFRRREKQSHHFFRCRDIIKKWRTGL